MADAEDIQPLVCDNGTGMVKVSQYISCLLFGPSSVLLLLFSYFETLLIYCFVYRLVLLVMMLLGQCFLVLWAGPVTLVLWLGWAKKMLMLVMKPNPRGVFLP